MPTRLYVVGNVEATPTIIEADPQRTVLIVQNLDTVAGTDYLYMGDERGEVTIQGVQIAPVGGSLTLRRTMGEEPEKTWYLVSATAACPVRVMTLMGEPAIIVEKKKEEPSPQEPDKPAQKMDAPKMKKIKVPLSGYL